MSGKKKTKSVTVPLESFLATPAPDDNWAAIEDDDEYNDAPESGSGFSSYDRPQDGGRYDRDSYDRSDRYGDRPRRSYDDRPPRNDAPQKPLPDGPPFVAYVGNLSYSVDEDELGNFFAENCEVTDVRVLSDMETGKSKGFGYVTFADRDSLAMALEANNFELGGRPLRVDVAEGRSEDSRGGRGREQRGPSRADLADKWERGKSIPAAEKREERGRFGGRRGDDRERRDDRRDRPTERRERKPLNLQPRKTDAPVGLPVEAKKSSNPFGGAKPRDELAFQKKKEEERAQREKERAQRNKTTDKPSFSQKPKSGGSFKSKNSNSSGRDFTTARSNMGKPPARTAEKSKSQDKKPKQPKPQSVQKETAAIPCKNIYSALKQDD